MCWRPQACDPLEQEGQVVVSAGDQTLVLWECTMLSGLCALGGFHSYSKGQPPQSAGELKHLR